MMEGTQMGALNQANQWRAGDFLSCRAKETKGDDKMNYEEVWYA